MHRTVEHLYVHVPFCDGKCDYCAFYSVPHNSDLAARYVRCLAAELETCARQFSLEPRTLFVGGGTPSVLSAQSITNLLTSVRERISCHDLSEFTVEVNPGTLDRRRMTALLHAGVNRISIGAQSFHDTALLRIGRRHTVRHIRQCVCIAREGGIKNMGLDLISGIPGTDMCSWRQTLDAVICLNPDHVSVYSLSVEPGTSLAAAVSGNRVVMQTDEQQLDAMNMAERVLHSAGYSRYEISNFARPGYECAHNVACWRGMDYLGLGPGASSRIGLSRWTNLPDVNSYCDRLEQGDLPPRSFEEVSARTDATERLMFQFRLAEGVRDATLRQAPQSTEGTLESSLQHLATDGLIALAGDRWILTSKGRNFADRVAAEFA